MRGRKNSNPKPAFKSDQDRRECFEEIQRYSNRARRRGEAIAPTEAPQIIFNLRQRLAIANQAIATLTAEIDKVSNLKSYVRDLEKQLREAQRQRDEAIAHSLRLQKRGAA